MAQIREILWSAAFVALVGIGVFLLLQCESMPESLIDVGVMGWR